MSNKEVERHYKRYKTFMEAKTIETFVDSFLSLHIRAVAMFVQIIDVEALQYDLRKDYTINKEFSAF